MLDSTIWGPHYWFVLHTISVNYPLRPNTVTKKKYYNFIHHFLPIIIPSESMSNDFIKLLDKYPVSPYLDTRDSFIRWMHFIHNKINQSLKKQEISLNDFYLNYYENYKPREKRMKDFYKFRGQIIYLILIIVILLITYYLYNS